MVPIIILFLMSVLTPKPMHEFLMRSAPTVSFRRREPRISNYLPVLSAIQSPMTVSAAGENVSSIWAYSDGDPVFAV